MASAKASVLPPVWLAALVIVAAAAAATAAPLLTYSLTLATFGAAHVFAELRYVEARFSARFRDRLARGLGLLLAGVVGLRLLGVLGLWSGPGAVQAELMLVAGLGALVLPALAEAGALAAGVGLGVIAGVGIGLTAAPVWTLLLLTCLHNWTPVGLLAEGLPARERRRGLIFACVAFGLVPAGIAAGLPGWALAALGAGWPELTALPTGPLSAHLGAYLPAELHQLPWAVSAFSALAFAQCMHYAAVIGVLPRIAPGGPRADAIVGLSRVPRAAFVAGVSALTASLLCGYAFDFKGARAWYGLVASVHAWLEVPVLLLALAPPAAGVQAPGALKAPARR